MKFIFLFLNIFFVVSLYSQQFENEAINQIKNYNSIKLENGLTIVCLENKDSLNYFIRFYTDLPEYVSENYRNVHAINKQIQNSSEISKSVNSYFKFLNADIQKDKFGYFFNCSSEKIDTVFYFLSDFVQNYKYHKSEIEKSKNIIISKTDSLKPLLNNKIDRITRGEVYGKSHSYSYLLQANEINKITEDDLSEFYEKFYKPNNSYVVVIGKINIDSLKPFVEKAFISWKNKDLPESKYKLEKIEEPKIVFFDTIPLGQRKLSMIFPFSLYPFTFDAEKAELLSILVQQLLSKKLIEENSLASEIKAGFHNDKITGNYQMQIWFEKDSINQLIKNIISVINQLKNGNFDKEELEYAKKILINDFKSKNGDNQIITSLILNTEINNLSKNYYADFVKDINNFTVKEVQTFTEKYLSYNTSIFTISGKWYPSLHDIVKLSKDFRIELFNLDGTIKKFIPKGFNGFHIIEDYILAIGGREIIEKTKDATIKISGIYEMNEQQIFIDGEILHKSPKYLFDVSMIRPKKDTIFLHKQIFDGKIAFDSTMVEGKILEGNEFEILKYKSPIVPEIYYKDWQFESKIIKVDTLNSKYVYVVEFKNQAKQQIIDYYDVDSALRLKREIFDKSDLGKRTIEFSKYFREKDKEILYPYKQTITSEKVKIIMIIRNVDYKSKIDKKKFNLTM
ncbi:MAG: insulinase family protein [Bacteroidales bacterium]|nr:insulinase family protein [Bacteroidales bacterium]